MKGYIRKILIFIVMVFCLVSIMSITSFAQFPSKPITLICQFSAGGTTDLSLRVLSSLASAELGVPINVVNKTGGGGVIGYTFLMNSKPDGYTIGGFGGGASAVAPRVSDVAFSIKRDFDYIIKYGEYFFSSVIRVDSPWETLNDLIKYAKEHPGQIKYSASGINASTYLLTESLAKESGIEIVHVPQAGGSAAIAALLGGHIDMATCAEGIGGVKSGQLRMLVQYSEVKHKDFQDVPTAIELGFDLGLDNSFGIAGPKGIPEDRKQILHDAFKKAQEHEAFKILMDRLELISSYGDGAYFESLMFKYDDRVEELMKAGVITVD